MTNTATQTASKDFVISRVFNAPRVLVWKSFTDSECMKQWWGPKGFKVIASKMDLWVGGTYHYGMETPDGKSCGQIRLSRNHASGAPSFRQFVFGRRRRHHKASNGACLAA